MTPTVHILIPAAGASLRMRGEDKLLLSVWDRPLLRQTAETALATQAPVFVTLPPDATARRSVLAGLALTVVDIPDANLGMSRSLIGGLMAIKRGGPSDGLMILPADMPDLTTLALIRLIRAFQAAPDLILRGAAMDEPGHPVIFPHSLWPDLLFVTGDEGGRSVLRRNQDNIRLVPLPGRMALTDLDNPEDWQAWRAGQMSQDPI